MASGRSRMIAAKAGWKSPTTRTSTGMSTVLAADAAIFVSAKQRAVGRNEVHRAANELGGDRHEPVRCPLAVAVFIGNVLAFDVSELAQGLPEGLPHRRVVKDADARDFRRLLRPRASHLGREQQAAAPDQGNELTPRRVEHGDFLPDALSALPTGPCLVFSHSQPTAGRPASPWGRPELF